MAEIANPIEEIKLTMDIIRPILEQFDTISDIYYPIDSSFKVNI